MNFKALTEKKNDLITRAESIVKDAELNKRELTDDEKEELAEIRDNVRDIKAKLDALEMIAAETETEKKEEGDEMADDKRTLDDTEALEVRAFEDYVRGVVNERTDYNMEKSANGAVIPTTIANRIIKRVYDVCPILERSTKYNLKGKLEIPYYDESTHAVTVDYATEFEELAGSVGSFTKIELDGFLAGALVLISRSLINNAQFNVVDFIVDLVLNLFGGKSLYTPEDNEWWSKEIGEIRTCINRLIFTIDATNNYLPKEITTIVNLMNEIFKGEKYLLKMIREQNEKE